MTEASDFILLHVATHLSRPLAEETVLSPLTCTGTFWKIGGLCCHFLGFLSLKLLSGLPGDFECNNNAFLLLITYYCYARHIIDILFCPHNSSARFNTNKCYYSQLRDKQIETQDFSHLLRVVQSVAQLGLELSQCGSKASACLFTVVLCSRRFHQLGHPFWDSWGFA